MEAGQGEAASITGATVSSLPIKPIVSDLTVSSSKGGEDESSVTTLRDDENTQRRAAGEDDDRERAPPQDKPTAGSSKTSSTGEHSGPCHHGNNKPPQTSSSTSNPTGSRYHYPPHGSGIIQQAPPPRGGQFIPMNRGPGGPHFGGPPFYPGMNNGSFGGPPPPPPHLHHGPPHPFHPGAPHVPSHMQHHLHGHHPMMQPPPFQGGYPPMNHNGSFPHHHHHHPHHHMSSHGPPPPYGGGPYGMPPNGFHGMGPMYNMSNPSSLPNIMSSDSNSISSTRSKSSRNSSKKRTIENVVSSNSIPSAYSFRRTDSASSSTSTVTANNTHGGEATVDGGLGDKSPKHQPKPEIASSGAATGDAPQGDSAAKRRGYHRRDYSGASTASSLSVGGYSLESYEGPRVGAAEDTIPMGASSLLDQSPKRQKGSGDNVLMVDTGTRPDSVSVDADQSSRFEQLSIDATKLPNSTSSASSAGQDRSLFLSLSTSPIHNDADATPTNKDTSSKLPKKTTAKEAASVKKVKPTIDTSAAVAVDRHSDTPTPPVHGESGSSLNDEHSMLNQHLRNQTFTPLNHENQGASPSHGGFASAIHPQLSWDIAGDTPSLGDLADWDVDKISKTAAKDGHKSRPSSTSSSSTRNMMISPHDYQFWKDESEMPIPDSAMTGVGGTTTPLPLFFGHTNGEGSENQSKKNGESDHIHQMFLTNSGRPVMPGASGQKMSSKPMPLPVWSKHHDPSGMPPTPLYMTSEYRDDGYGPRSPMGVDRREMEYYPFPPHMGHMHNDRVRNLRGRLPPGSHMPPMPLHIPPHMSAHLPMTSPMGLGPKAGLWSPHHMPPQLASPGHMGSPMAQSRRKCVSLKPPIPSKFQGDMDKSKSALVPEFTNLVNFPAYMSQKQTINLPEGMRCCVMCGQACPCSTANKTKKTKKPGCDGSVGPHGSGHDQLGDKNSGYAIIPTQNKGLCTLCDVNVWVVVSSGLEIKWCKGCKNFRPWAAFGDKGLATKCLRCRDRQREKYALQKEEKEKTRSTTTTTTNTTVPHKIKMTLSD